ncbi:hypothetical protein M2277_005034 [Paenibacillus sp. LBL]|uniref:hypothetical protein n=1 Tax=Paenibacillus sp. LBL TaxID=2940563 RepID=UPI002475DD1E|nr:hypothetical protein [Paenibacillus sp. LBL]MDH6674342.1 hypothetical protein [Paenibacillus sp. LBL]
MKKKIPNYYDLSKLSDKAERMKRKVKLESTRSVEENPKIAPDHEMEYWKTKLTYKGKSIEAMYVMPEGLGPEPMIEHVLGSLFSNIHVYDKYKGRIFDFINDFPGMTKDFKSAEELLTGIGQISEELRHLFGDDYEAYKKEFIKINMIEDMIKDRS